MCCFQCNYWVGPIGLITPFQMIPAFYKVMGQDGPEAKEELYKHLTAFEKELNGNKFIGGGSSLIFKKMFYMDPKFL